jgi:hypothetical protein
LEVAEVASSIIRLVSMEGSWIINTLPHKLVWWHGIKLMRWEVMRGSWWWPNVITVTKNLVRG